MTAIRGALPESDRYQVDMCRGPLLRQIVMFAIPLIASGILQLFFNAADLFVVGRFSASHRALAAVGATGPITHTLINLFIGLSIGANVLVANHLGAHDRKGTSRTAHTAVMISLLGGALLAAAGIASAERLLRLAGTPEDILDQSVLYMRIFFAGMPLIMLYNFGSAVLRAMGDTRRPFRFLVIAGIINVGLNLFFVICLRWDVAGVAAATVISQGVAALLVLRVLTNLRTACRVKLGNLRIEWKSLRAMMWIGVPAGFQASCYSISNIIIQTALNSFGSAAVAGFTAAGTWEVVGYVSAAAIGQTALSFTGQNSGGRQYARLRRALWYCAALSGGTLLVLGAAMLVWARPLTAVFNSSPDVVAAGAERFRLTMPLFFVCGTAEILTSVLRGLGKSVIPALITVFCVCVARIVYILTLWQCYHTLGTLMLTYPVTWSLNGIITGIYLHFVLRKLPKTDAPRP